FDCFLASLNATTRQKSEETQEEEPVSETLVSEQEIAPMSTAASEEAPELLPPQVDAATLSKYFTLSEADRAEVKRCRGAVNKVGFAVQLCMLRWRGYFLKDAGAVPWPVLETLTQQLGLLPPPLANYPKDEKTRFEPLERIRRYLGFVRCDAPQRRRLRDYLIRVTQACPRATTLRQMAERWLYEHKIVRPGRTTVQEILSAAREIALQRVY